MRIVTIEIECERCGSRDTYNGHAARAIIDCYNVAALSLGRPQIEAGDSIIISRCDACEVLSADAIEREAVR